MTHRDAAIGRHIVVRWCNLAEKRLEYLTELFETGRWRRYYGEVAFLENIQEAKAAVEIWRDLLRYQDAAGKAAPAPIAVHASWRQAESLRPSGQLPRPLPGPIIIEPLRQVPADILVALESQLHPPDETPVLDDDGPLPAPGLDRMKERYPLLRNTL
jgi:hypothetical protein